MPGVLQIVPHDDAPMEAVFSASRRLGAALESRGFSARVVGGHGLLGRGFAGMVKALEDARSGVLLHYANYAYEARGCPRGLVVGLEGWRRMTGARLVTVFHEIAADGAPWTSAYWLRRLQLSLARRLVRISDATATSIPIYWDVLRELGGAPELLPMFSPCGEPAEVDDHDHRSARLVVLGGAGARSRIYGELRQALEAAVAVTHPELIVDIGAPVAAPDRVGPVPIARLGLASEARLSSELRLAREGIVGHEPAFLGKSATYAAYAAHGVAPIALGRPTRAATGPPHWSPWAEPEPPAGRLARAAREARAAYQGSRLDVHADFYARALLGRGAA